MEDDGERWKKQEKQKLTRDYLRKDVINLI